ncbi:uncharacterized protein LOC144620978 [Crassostrea virginica]
MFITLTNKLYTKSVRIASGSISHLVNSIRNGPVKPLTRRGTKAGRSLIRKIKTVTGFSNTFYHSTQNGVHSRNLVSLKTDDQTQSNAIPVRITQCPAIHRHCSLTPEHSTHSKVLPIIRRTQVINPLKLYTLNCRSVKNKALSVSDLIISNEIDLAALTETWLGTDIDSIVLGDLVPEGYDIYNTPRKMRGGGVALIYNKSISVRLLTSDLTFTQFEHLECAIISQNTKLRLCIIYRPPPSKSNKLCVTTFFEEWSQYLSVHALSPEEIIITGDLNFHLDVQQDTNSQRFIQSLHEHGLKQIVDQPTHVRGHILDVVVIRENSRLLQANPIVDDQYICDSNGIVSCDHRGITSLMNSTKPPRIQKTISIRKYRNIDVGDFERDIASVLKTTCELGLDGIVDLYHEGVKAMNMHRLKPRQ